MNDIKQYTILDEADATGVGKIAYTGDSKSVHFTFNTDGGGTANGTVQFQVSNQDDVDFDAAQSATNRWEYVDVIDSQDGSSIDGDTGIALAGADDNRALYLNVDPGTRWATANLTAYTAGKFTVHATLSSK